MNKYSNRDVFPTRFINSKPIPLKVNENNEFTLPVDVYAHFYVKMEDINTDIRINVGVQPPVKTRSKNRYHEDTPVAKSKPCSELFVSTTVRHPTSREHSWRSGKVYGKETLNISRIHPKLRTGRFYIAVYSYSEVDVELSVVSAQDTSDGHNPSKPRIHTLTEGQAHLGIVDSHCCKYYVYNLNMAPSSSLMVKMTVPKGIADLYLCASNQRPSAAKCTWRTEGRRTQYQTFIPASELGGVRRVYLGVRAVGHTVFHLSLDEVRSSQTLYDRAGVQGSLSPGQVAEYQAWVPKLGWMIKCEAGEVDVYASTHDRHPSAMSHQYRASRKGSSYVLVLGPPPSAPFNKYFFSVVARSETYAKIILSKVREVAMPRRVVARIPSPSRTTVEDDDEDVATPDPVTRKPPPAWPVDPQYSTMGGADTYHDIRKMNAWSAYRTQNMDLDAPGTTNGDGEPTQQNMGDPAEINHEFGLVGRDMQPVYPGAGPSASEGLREAYDMLGEYDRSVLVSPGEEAMRAAIALAHETKDKEPRVRRAQHAAAFHSLDGALMNEMESAKTFAVAMEKYEIANSESRVRHPMERTTQESRRRPASGASTRRVRPLAEESYAERARKIMLEHTRPKSAGARVNAACLPEVSTLVLNYIKSGYPRKGIENEPVRPFGIVYSESTRQDILEAGTVMDASAVEGTASFSELTTATRDTSIAQEQDDEDMARVPPPSISMNSRIDRTILDDPALQPMDTNKHEDFTVRHPLPPETKEVARLGLAAPTETTGMTIFGTADWSTHSDSENLYFRVRPRPRWQYSFMNSRTKLL